MEQQERALEALRTQQEEEQRDRALGKFVDANSVSIDRFTFHVSRFIALRSSSSLADLPSGAQISAGPLRKTRLRYQG